MVKNEYFRKCSSPSGVSVMRIQIGKLRFRDNIKLSIAFQSILRSCKSECHSGKKQTTVSAAGGLKIPYMCTEAQTDGTRRANPPMMS